MPTSSEFNLDVAKSSQQLVISEVRFQAIFEQMNVGICQADLDGYLVDANPGLCKMLGYTRDELVHKKFQHITHPADLNTDLEEYERLLQGHQNSMFVEKRYHPQRWPCHLGGANSMPGARMPWGNRCTALGFLKILAIAKPLNLALKASHQHVTDILESITDAFFALDHRLALYVLKSDGPSNF
jgi:hypothetical protein